MVLDIEIALHRRDAGHIGARRGSHLGRKEDGENRRGPLPPSRKVERIPGIVWRELDPDDVCILWGSLRLPYPFRLAIWHDIGRETGLFDVALLWLLYRALF